MWPHQGHDREHCRDPQSSDTPIAAAKALFRLMKIQHRLRKHECQADGHRYLLTWRSKLESRLKGEP